MYAQEKHCRWCGVSYYATKPPDRDGFCIPAHKMAHYRAYKNYVTAAARQNAGPRDCRVTRKKRKKRK